MAIEHDRFITIVQQAAGVDREPAERAAQATDEFFDVTVQLPDEYLSLLARA